MTIALTFSVASGKTLTIGQADVGRLDLTLASTATGTINGTVFMNSYTGSQSGNYDRDFTNNGNLTISATGLVNGQYSTSNNRGASFVLNSGGTLHIAHTSGIAAGTGAGASGAIITYIRSFSTGANYDYNGTANQSTGSGLPTGLTGKLTISNTGPSGNNTVSLSNSESVANGGSVDLVSGIFAAGTNFTLGTATSTLNRSEGSMTGTVQGINSFTYNLNYTGNSKTTGPEATGTGLNNFTVALSSGQTLTTDRTISPDNNVSVNSGTLYLPSLTINRSASGGGTLTISSGATLNIGGIMTLPSNYATHSIGATSTIEYSGTNQAVAALNSSQSYGNLYLSGSGTKSFSGTRTITNNFSISTGSVANLGTYTHSAGTLTLGGSGTASGSWGSTSSGATNKNDTYFALTSGIVNVTNSSCPAITAAISGTNTICAGSGSNLYVTISGGVAPYTVVYTGGGGGTVSNYTSGTAIPVTPSSTTTYSLSSVIDAYNCPATCSGSAQITVNSPSTAPSSITGTSSICAGSSATLATSGGTLGTDARDVWYAGGCPSEAFTEEWTTQPYGISGSTVNSNTNGILNVTSTDGDPMIHMENIGSFDASVYKYIQVRYRVITSAGGSIEIYFSKTGGSDLSESQVVRENLISDNAWHTANMDMSANANWTGTITGWRYDWCTQSGENLELDFITLADRPVLGTGTSITVTPATNTTYYTGKKGACNTTTCASQTVTVWPVPTFTTAGHNISCYGLSDGSIDVHVTSADHHGYTYSFNNGTSYIGTLSGTYPDYQITGLTAGNFNIKIKDTNNCESADCP